MSETLEVARVENSTDQSKPPAGIFRRAASWWAGLLGAIGLSLFIGIRPRWCAEQWKRVSIGQAAVVAAGHIMMLGYWFLALMTAYDLHRLNGLRNPITGDWYADLAGPIHKFWKINSIAIQQLIGRGVYTRTMSVVAAALIVLILLGLIFFVLIPFAARPGRNRPCLKHVMRAALLGTGFIHFWMAALTGAFATMIFFQMPATGPWLSIELTAACALALWTLWALIRAVRVDYRGPNDGPKKLPLRCEACGYDIHLAEMDGKCSECGKPVAESLDPEFRKPTAWERTTNFAAAKEQLHEIISEPRRLLSRMPTATGQPEAQKWMLRSMVIVGFFAAWTIPLLALLLKYGYIGKNAAPWTRNLPEEIEWTGEIFVLIALGGIAMGILWATFGMMMVGVETVGVVAVAHFRKNYVPLASAAKVTCYASTLMVPWAITGGLQILVVVMAYQMGWFRIHPLAEQIGLVGTTAIAHIGGLMWFEWTVYRGLRGIQYANH